jgi:hypothetical protein
MNGVTTCKSCGAAMPFEMRFCRACGQRLGEGLAEYVETVRFQNPLPTGERTRIPSAVTADQLPARETAPPRLINNFGPRVAENPLHGAFKSVEEIFKNLEEAFKQKRVKLATQTNRGFPFGKSRTVDFNHLKEEANKPRGLCVGRLLRTFLVIAFVALLIIASLLAPHNLHRENRDARGAASAARKEAAAAMRQQAAALRVAALKAREEIIAGVNGNQASIGVSNFKSSGGGALIESIALPGSPADKAGLIGGDVITGLDDQPVKSESDLRRLLIAKPIGKSVDVLFLRDGETKHAPLMTISADELERISDSWNESSDNHGSLGLDDAEFTRVAVPGTNIYGVRLGEVEQDSPAYLAGLREKDILIEFNGTPIRTAEELAARIERAAPGSTVKAVVVRGAEQLTIPVRMNQEE